MEQPYEAAPSRNFGSTGWVFILVGLVIKVIAVGSLASLVPSSAYDQLQGVMQGGASSDFAWKAAALDTLSEFGLVCTVIGAAVVILSYLGRALRA